MPLETGASEMELYVSGRYLSCTKPTSNTNSFTLSQIVAIPGVGYRIWPVFLMIWEFPHVDITPENRAYC